MAFRRLWKVSWPQHHIRYCTGHVLKELLVLYIYQRTHSKSYCNLDLSIRPFYCYWSYYDLKDVSQIASLAGIWAGQPSMPGPSPVWATYGIRPWLLQDLSGARPGQPRLPVRACTNPAWGPYGICMGNFRRTRWCDQGLRLGTARPAPGRESTGPYESQSAQSCPDKSRLRSERARYLGSVWLCGISFLDLLKWYMHDTFFSQMRRPIGSTKYLNGIRKMYMQQISMYWHVTCILRKINL